MIKIISDSTCDLSPELLEKYDVSIIPLNIHLGDEEYQDGINISPDEIYKWSDENETTPKTSAISIVSAIEAFEKYTADGGEVIAFSISDEMSTTGNVMPMAAEDIGKEDKVHVINSANLSTGVGLLVIAAAEMAQQGKSAGEIVEAIEKLKPRVRSSFVVDTLTYLHRGGRCGSVAALAGSILQLHPKIVVENGAMHATKKYRGKMKSVILSYAKELEEELGKAIKDRVFITHSGCDEETISSVYEYVKSLGLFNEIHITRAGGVISSHCGPGTLGVLFIEE